MRPDPKKLEAALQALDEALKEENPDYSWADDLPEAPPLPEQPGETIAIFIPKRSDGGNTESE